VKSHRVSETGVFMWARVHNFYFSTVVSWVLVILSIAFFYRIPMGLRGITKLKSDEQLLLA